MERQESEKVSMEKRLKKRIVNLIQYHPALANSSVSL
jgi:hypothetical protein